MTREQPPTTARRYSCSRCKATVLLYLPATVSCSRCGRLMRADPPAPAGGEKGAGDRRAA